MCLEHNCALCQSTSVPGQPPLPFQLECIPALPGRNPHSLSAESILARRASLHSPWPSLSSPAQKTSVDKLLHCSSTFSSLQPVALALRLNQLLSGLQPSPRSRLLLPSRTAPVPSSLATLSTLPDSASLRDSLGSLPPSSHPDLF